MQDTKSLTRFDEFEIDQSKILKIKGGWSDSVETPTGTVTHHIDEQSGEDYWELHGDILAFSDSAQRFADRGDHQ